MRDSGTASLADNSIAASIVAVRSALVTVREKGT